MPTILVTVNVHDGPGVLQALQRALPGAQRLVSECVEGYLHVAALDPASIATNGTAHVPDAMVAALILRDGDELAAERVHPDVRGLLTDPSLDVWRREVLRAAHRAAIALDPRTHLLPVRHAALPPFEVVGSSSDWSSTAPSDAPGVPE